MEPKMEQSRAELSNGISKRKYKIQSIWPMWAEELLVDLWAKRSSDLSTKMNRYEYTEIAAILRRAGHSASILDVRSKIINMIGKYKREKLGVQLSCGEPSEWPLYVKIDSIFTKVTPDDIKKENISEVGYNEGSQLEHSLPCACSETATSNEDITVDKKRKIQVKLNLTQAGSELEKPVHSYPQVAFLNHVQMNKKNGRSELSLEQITDPTATQWEEANSVSNSPEPNHLTPAEKRMKFKENRELVAVDKSSLESILPKSPQLEISTEKRPSEYFLLSLVPDMESMTDREQLMFKRGVIDLIEAIKYGANNID